MSLITIVGEALLALDKKYRKSKHQENNDYAIAYGGDSRYIGSPLCLRGRDGKDCPLGEYRGKSGQIILTGYVGEGGKYLIHPGEDITICTLGRRATSDSQKTDNRRYATG